MSVSEWLQSRMRGAEALWVSSRRHAEALLAALALVGISIVVAERLPAWHLLALTAPKPEADEWERISARLAHARHETSDIVLMLGGSATREFSISDADISRQLSAACRRPVSFINAGTSSQNFAETWLLTEAVPSERLALVVLGFNYFRLEDDAASVARSTTLGRFPIPQPDSLARVMARYDHTLAQAPFGIPGLAWLARHGTHYEWSDVSNKTAAWDGPRYQYAPPAKTLPEKQAIAAQYLAERLQLFARHHQESTALWAEYVRHVRGRGSNLLVLALPESAALVPVARLLGPAFERSLDGMAASGAQIQDWRGRQLPEAAFYDQQHLLASGRQAVARPFLKALQASLPGCSAGKAGP